MSEGQGMATATRGYKGQEKNFLWVSDESVIGAVLNASQ